MWEIIRTILAAAKEGFNLFKESKDKIKAESKSKIGYDLFMVYTQLNDVLINGDKIVNYLEAFAIADLNSRTYSHSFPVSSTYTVADGQISQREKYLNLQDLITEQIHSIEIILNLLGGGLRIEVDAVSGNFRRHILDEITLKKMRIGLLILKRNDSDFSNSISKNIVPKRISFSQEQQQKVKDYLRYYEPRKRLDEIQELIEGFRETLEKNFSITDILVKVRDKDHRTTLSLLERY